MKKASLPGLKSELGELFKKINFHIDSLYEIAIKDEKTGLYNNKFFETILEMEFDKAKRGKQKLSLIIVDIDFFKKVNDKYGHMQADKLLAQLAKVIQKTVRRSDIPARFGGEELFILLPETPITRAKKVGTRLRNAIHKDRMLKKHNLTVSGGITQMKMKDTKAQFKSRADKALYKAKKDGRDNFKVLK